ncbi:MAG: hypothetical protein OHK0029_06190 [Armatimonadaceae bacterium]
MTKPIRRAQNITFFGSWTADRILAASLFAFAFLVQVAFLVQFSSSPFFWVPRLDALYHDVMARQVILNDLPNEPFFRAPAYGYFLALIFAAFGVQNYVAVRIVHALVESASVALLFALGSRLFSRPVGVVAAVTMALYGPLIYLISDLHTSVLEVFFALVFARQYVEILRNKDSGFHKNAGIAGLALGLWAITRPNALLLLPPALAGIVLPPGKPTSRKAIAWFLAGWLAFPLLVTARNAVVGKDFVFIASQGGINLFLGNRPEADGFTPSTPKRYPVQGEYQDSVELYGKYAASEANGRLMKPSEVNRYWIGRSLDFWRENPVAALRLTGKKLVLAFSNREVRNNTGYDYIVTEWVPLLRGAFFGFWYAGPFGLLGMALAWRLVPMSRAFSVMALVYFASFIPFFVADRFRLPIIPYLLLFAAFAVWQMVQWATMRKVRPVLASAVLVGGFGVLSWVEWVPTMTRSVWAQDIWSAGNRWNALGKYDKGEAQMRRALALDPQNYEIWSGLGEALFYRKRYDDAIVAFREGIRLSPTYPVGMVFNLALCYKGKGDYATTRKLLREVLDHSPDHFWAQKQWEALDEWEKSSGKGPRQEPAQPASGS